MTRRERFCDRIISSAPDKELGITSDHRGRQTFPSLPWAAFFQYATLLLPQAYWRSTDGRIGRGTPAANYQVALACWREAGAGDLPIVPMAGELGSATAAEIGQYAEVAREHDVQSLHFYCDDESVTEEVWSAVRQSR